MADVFFLASAVAFVVCGTWLLLRPRWWANTIRQSGVYGDFWTSPLGMAINRLLAVVGILVGLLLIIRYLA